MSNEKSTIGDNIKKYRNKLGISQDVLSKKQIWLFIQLLKLRRVRHQTPLLIQLKKLQTHWAFRLMF